MNQGHGKAVDWWSLGTLLYEMMAGLPPFYDQNMQTMYEKIMYDELLFPKFFSAEARSLLTGMLERDVRSRILRALVVSRRCVTKFPHGYFVPSVFHGCITAEQTTGFWRSQRNHGSSILCAIGLGRCDGTRGSP